MELRRKTLTLRSYEVVSGVRVTGQLDERLTGTLTVTGRGETGTLTIGRKTFSGTLGGTQVRYKPLPLGA
jgi:hypothetical protein